VGMPLPQHPARVKVTLADGAVGWLADPPEAPIGSHIGGGSLTSGQAPGSGLGRARLSSSGRPATLASAVRGRRAGEPASSPGVPRRPRGPGSVPRAGVRDPGRRAGPAAADHGGQLFKDPAVNGVAAEERSRTHSLRRGKSVHLSKPSRSTATRIGASGTGTSARRVRRLSVPMPRLLVPVRGLSVPTSRWSRAVRQAS
jgi:hypothetical protein